MNKVLVFGDIMLDDYVYGDVARVSPEAPVPVVRVTGGKHKLGGAGNVVDNLVSLGCHVAGVFAIGTDEGSRLIKQLLADADISLSNVMEDESVCGIRKTRVIGNSQQIARIDREAPIEMSTELEARILEAFDAKLPEVDVAVISDYGKGVCTKGLCEGLISRSQDLGVPVIVDPKGRAWEKYRGATVITPNLKEINDYSGCAIDNCDSEIEGVYSSYPDLLKVDNLLLTRSERGMSLIARGAVVHLETNARQVFDVSGAGDTVVAALAAYLAGDASNIIEAATIANVAAGIAVGKAGTAVVTCEEIAAFQRGVSASPRDKVFPISDRGRLMELLDDWRKAGNTVAATGGCFDILHRGHAQLLNRVAEMADRVVVVLNSDASVKRLKGPERPINGEYDRAAVLASLAAVDAVAIFDPVLENPMLEGQCGADTSNWCDYGAREAPMRILEMIAPDVFVKGGDYSEETVPEAVFAKSFVSVPFVEGYSTTGVVDKMKGHE